MRYNSQTVKFNLLKHTVQWVLVYLFTKLRNHQPCLIPEYFHYPKKKPCGPWESFPTLPLPSSPASVGLPIPDLSSKWTHSVCGLLFLAYSTLCVLKVRLCCSMPHCFTLFTYLLVYFKIQAYFPQHNTTNLQEAAVKRETSETP